MDTGSAQQATDSADIFEPFADFKVSFRTLALRLVELHAPPAGDTTWPFTGPAPVSADERAMLADLAFDHFLRHDISTTPAAPRCVCADGACKALGAAQVVLALGWSPADERGTASSRARCMGCRPASPRCSRSRPR